MTKKTSATKVSQEFIVWSEVPVGTSFKVVRNTNGHNYPMNVELSVERTPSTDCGVVISEYNNLKISDVEFLETTIESLDKKKEALQKSLNDLQEIQDFMKKHNITYYSPKIKRAAEYLENLGIYDIKKAEELAKQLR